MADGLYDLDAGSGSSWYFDRCSLGIATALLRLLGSPGFSGTLSSSDEGVSESESTACFVDAFFFDALLEGESTSLLPSTLAWYAS